MNLAHSLLDAHILLVSFLCPRSFHSSSLDFYWLLQGTPNLASLYIASSSIPISELVSVDKQQWDFSLDLTRTKFGAAELIIVTDFLSNHKIS